MTITAAEKMLLMIVTAYPNQSERRASQPAITTPKLDRGRGWGRVHRALNAVKSVKYPLTKPDEPDGDSDLPLRHLAVDDKLVR